MSEIIIDGKPVTLEVLKEYQANTNIMLVKVSENVYTTKQKLKG